MSEEFASWRFHKEWDKFRTLVPITNDYDFMWRYPRLALLTFNSAVVSIRLGLPSH